MARMMADYFRDALADEHIDKQPLTGAIDLGDIKGVRIHGQKIAVEVKDVVKMNLAGWAKEAEIERGNLDALAGVIVHKRHGKADPGDQWVSMTARDFAAIISGQRDPE